MWKYLLGSLFVTLASIMLRRSFSSPPSIVDHPETRYDYIVVGAGTAGCVMASRLSEDPNVTVLLVEAGGFFNWLASVPLAAPALQKSPMDWMYRTESQATSSRGMWDYVHLIPRGKGLGGSGQINYLLHSFGRVEDFSKWPRGWSHSELQPYFGRVLERMRVKRLEPEEAQLAQAMLVARDALNHTRAEFAMPHSTGNNGARWSTLHAYLQPAWTRPNLHILVNTIASKVLLDANNRIEGIEIRYENEIYEKIEAAREVILCAGAIGTPHLLMVSGIGPSDVLTSSKIPVKHNSPNVGKNYADHVNMPVYVNLEAPVSITLKKLQTVSTLVNYLIFGTGFLATNGIMGMARLDESAVLLAAVGSADEKFLKDISNYRSETFRALFPTYNDTSGEGFVFMSSCQQPKSRGNVTVRSADLRDPPLINPAYLEHDYDIACGIKGIRLGMSIIKTPLFREFGAEVHHPRLEECQHLPQDYRDDAYAECVMRTGALTGHHPCGTCRMADDPTLGVVDPFLRVYGIEGLRIADASVLPIPVSGTPNSVIIAVAEKAADIVLQVSDSRQ